MEKCRFFYRWPSRFIAKTEIFESYMEPEDYMNQKIGNISGIKSFTKKVLSNITLLTSNFGIMAYRFEIIPDDRFKLMLPRHGPKKFDNPDVPKKNWGLKDKKYIFTKFSNKDLFKVKNEFLKIIKKKFLDVIKRIRKISKSEIIDNGCFSHLKNFI